MPDLALTDPPATVMADPLAFALASPVDVLAAQGIASLSGALVERHPGEAYPSLRLIGMDWDAPVPTLAAEPQPDGTVRLAIGDADHGLDWWRRILTLQPVAGAPYTPWKPWAGQVDIARQFAPFIADLSAATRGMTWREAVGVGGYGYHDWSGLDPYRTWTAGSLGFSPNMHPISVVGWPMRTALAVHAMQAHPVRRQGAVLRYGAVDHVTGEWIGYAARIVFRGEYHFSAGWGEPQT